MANRTVKDAQSVRGTNPQNLIEKIIRSRVYDCRYWKEECFALSAELVVDKAVELNYIGGVFGGNIKPTPFLCLTLKLLQLQPEKDIVVEFIKNEEYKYVRALGAIYMRLVGSSVDCYKYLEPLFNDNRKLRRQSRSGVFELVHMDEFIDELLCEERVCDIILPRIQKRHILEENNEIETKISALDDNTEEGLESSCDEEDILLIHRGKRRSFSYTRKPEKKRYCKSVGWERSPEKEKSKDTLYKDKYNFSHRDHRQSRERKSKINNRSYRHKNDSSRREGDKKRSCDREKVKDRDGKYRTRNKNHYSQIL